MTAPVSSGVAVVDGLFAETDDGPRLVGSRCGACGTPSFPATSFCHHPQCTNRLAVEKAEFGPRGVLWTVAIQNFPPPAPSKYDEPFRPYAMGLVDLEDGLRVMGQVSAADPNAVEVGSDVELVIEKLYTDDEGNDVVTWKFKPVG